MRVLHLFVASLLALVMIACTPNDPTTGRKQQVGTLAGAAAGGLAGSQIGDGRGQLVAVGVGTLLGAFLGSEIGKSLDRADQAALNRVTHQALETTPSGQTVGWTNPDSGHYVAATPQPAYQTASGQYCREFQQTITIDGRTETAYGTACRQPDGSWRIVS